MQQNASMSYNDLTNSENDTSRHVPADNSGYERFHIKQRITLMVNRYEILSVNADGSEGPMIAMAQQKRMAFKEEVTFYTDETRTQPVFSFKARRRLDLNAEYDVTDPSGRQIGLFSKDFGKSLLRSTWHLTSADGLQAIGTERSQPIAIGRRLWGFIPFIGEYVPCPFTFHFDFTAPDGSIVLSSVRKRSLRDRYDVTLPAAPNGWRLDWRVGAAMAVALDALQAR